MPLPSGFQSLCVHESAGLSQQIDLLNRQLRHHRLPGWWLYHSAAQAQRWIDYHQQFSPSHRQASMQTVHAKAALYAAKMVAQQHSTQGIHVVGLGCGTGQKDALQLLALQQQHSKAPLLYAALDVSHELTVTASHAALRAVAKASQQAAHPLQTHPLVLDFEQQPPLKTWFHTQEETAQCPHASRLFTCHGMLPNLHHSWFLPYLHGLLRPQDALLLSANLTPRGFATDHASILPQYDNAHARTWLAGACHALGFTLECCEISIQAALQGEPLAQDSRWQIVAHAKALQPQTLKPFAHTVCNLDAGERLQIFHSMRYTLGVLSDLLAKYGLRVKQTFVWEQQEEAVLYCTS